MAVVERPTREMQIVIDPRYQYRSERKPQGWIGADGDAKINALALRCRAGDTEALGELYSELLPNIKNAIRPYACKTYKLPVDIEVRDLYQQAYVELAEMIMDWEQRRSFAAYFLGCFRWRLHNFLRRHTPAWRSNRIEVFSMRHDVMTQTVADTSDPHDQDWDVDEERRGLFDVLDPHGQDRESEVECQELLDTLTPQQRRVVQLYVFYKIPMPDVGRILGFGQSSAYDFYYRALKRLRKALGDTIERRPSLQVAART